MSVGAAGQGARDRRHQSPAGLDRTSRRPFSTFLINSPIYKGLTQIDQNCA